MEFDSKRHWAMSKSYSRSLASYLTDNAMNLFLPNIEFGYMLVIHGAESTPLLKLIKHLKTL